MPHSGGSGWTSRWVSALRCASASTTATARSTHARPSGSDRSTSSRLEAGSTGPSSATPAGTVRRVVTPRSKTPPRRPHRPHRARPVDLYRPWNGSYSAATVGHGGLPSGAAAADPRRDSLMPTTAQQFGHYELEELLGVGGMGEVWRAKDLRRDRLVALKLLPENLGADHEYL